jgi:uncharacterized membrane protein
LEELDRTPDVAMPASQDRWLAAVSYLPILGLLTYFVFPERPFVRFHARQGVLLFFALVVGGLLLLVLDLTLGQIPFLGLLILILARLAFYLPALALMVLGFARGLTGELRPLPWLGHLEEKLPEPPGRGG